MVVVLTVSLMVAEAASQMTGTELVNIREGIFEQDIVEYKRDIHQKPALVIKHS